MFPVPSFSTPSDLQFTSIDSHYCTKLLEHGYEIVNKIGLGGFSNVYLVTSLKYHTSFVAKIINSPLCQNAYQEIQTLINITHKNVVRFYEYFEIDCPRDLQIHQQRPALFQPSPSIFQEKSPQTNLVMILEHCPNGTLADYIKHENVLRIDKFLVCADQIISAIQFCHEKGVSHRDIKPTNLLIDKYGRIKLSDFGLSSSKTIQNNEASDHHSNMKHANSHHRSSFSYRVNVQIGGSLPFMAPEAIKGESTNLFAADIWALGITFYSMLYGSVPWSTTIRSELQKEILSGVIHYENTINPKLIRFLTRILNPDPTLRPTIGEIEIMLKQVMEEILKEFEEDTSNTSESTQEIQSILSRFCKKGPAEMLFAPIIFQIKTSSSHFSLSLTPQSFTRNDNQQPLAIMGQQNLTQDSICLTDVTSKESIKKKVQSYRRSCVLISPQPLRSMKSTLHTVKHRQTFQTSHSPNYYTGAPREPYLYRTGPAKLFNTKTFSNDSNS